MNRLMMDKRNCKRWHRKLYFNSWYEHFDLFPRISDDYNKYGYYKWSFSIGWMFWYIYFSGEPQKV